MKFILSEAKLRGPAIERRIYRLSRRFRRLKSSTPGLIKTSGFWRELVKIRVKWHKIKSINPSE